MGRTGFNPCKQRIKPMQLQLNALQEDNRIIESAALEPPTTIGTKTYQVDEKGNLVISESKSFRNLSIIMPTSVALLIVLTLIIKERFFPTALGSTAFMIHPIFWAAIAIALLKYFSPKIETTVTHDGFAIWQPKDKYPPDKITGIKVTKLFWHDYCAVVESDLEKRNVSGVLYKEEAEEARQLILNFLKRDREDTE